MSKTTSYQPKTGELCHCRPGQQRDNCPDCEGTGMRIDFRAIHERVSSAVSPFKDSIRKAVVSAIAHLDRGTVGIGNDCLWQLTVKYIRNGPVGTNAAYVARQLFDEVITERAFSNFVYRQ